MPGIIASPQGNNVYETSHRLLSSSVGAQLKIIKEAPSSHMLGVFKTRVFDNIHTQMWRVAESAYVAGAKNADAVATASSKRELQNHIRAFASDSASQITVATSHPLSLQAELSKMQVASNRRTWTIATWQLSNAFFIGTYYGWKLRKTSKKQWRLSSVHDTDDRCDENEEQGAISVFDYFDSGVLYPPDHIGCLCDMVLFR